MNSNDIHTLVSDTVVEMEQAKFRKSVRGLLRKVLYKMDIPYHEVSILIDLYVPNHMIPFGLKLPEYVETLVHKIMKERS